MYPCLYPGTDFTSVVRVLTPKITLIYDDEGLARFIHQAGSVLTTPHHGISRFALFLLGLSHLSIGSGADLCQVGARAIWLPDFYQGQLC